MKKVVIPMLLLAVVSVANAQTTKPVSPAKKAVVAPMKNLLDSFSYAAGYNIALNMKDQGITNLNTALLQKAISDVFANKTPQLNTEQVNSSLQKQLQIFAEKKAEASKVAGRTFLETNKKRSGVTTTASGLQYEVLVAGDLASK